MTSVLNPEGSALRSQFAKKLLVQLGAFVSLTIVCLALWVLHHTLHEIRLADVLQHLKALSAPSVILAFAITATSYFVVTGYDVLALHHIYRPLPYPRAALASFLASDECSFIVGQVITCDGGRLLSRQADPPDVSS